MPEDAVPTVKDLDACLHNELVRRDIQPQATLLAAPDRSNLGAPQGCAFMVDISPKSDPYSWLFWVFPAFCVP